MDPGEGNRQVSNHRRRTPFAASLARALGEANITFRPARKRRTGCARAPQRLEERPWWPEFLAARKMRETQQQQARETLLERFLRTRAKAVIPRKPQPTAEAISA
jgi:siroheme synthase (precorrin-2 oxidase/ferrochelatase)